MEANTSDKLKNRQKSVPPEDEPFKRKREFKESSCNWVHIHREWDQAIDLADSNEWSQFRNE